MTSCHERWSHQLNLVGFPSFRTEHAFSCDRRNAAVVHGGIQRPDAGVETSVRVSSVRPRQSTESLRSWPHGILQPRHGWLSSQAQNGDGFLSTEVFVQSAAGSLREDCVRLLGRALQQAERPFWVTLWTAAPYPKLSGYGWPCGLDADNSFVAVCAESSRGTILAIPANCFFSKELMLQCAQSRWREIETLPKLGRERMCRNVKTEMKSPSFCQPSFHFQVTPGMRAMLVDWLTKVQQQFQFGLRTLFLTVNIVDRFLVTTPISRDCYQLLGITALLIAGKQVKLTDQNTKNWWTLQTVPFRLHIYRVFLSNAAFRPACMQHFCQTAFFASVLSESQILAFFRCRKNCIRQSCVNWCVYAATRTPRNRCASSSSWSCSASSGVCWRPRHTSSWNITPPRESTAHLSTVSQWSSAGALLCLPKVVLYFVGEQQKFHKQKSIWKGSKGMKDCLFFRTMFAWLFRMCCSSLIAKPECTRTCSCCFPRRTRALGRYLLEVSLQDYMLCQYQPSLLALAALEVADEVRVFHCFTSVRILPSLNVCIITWKFRMPKSHA